MGALLAIGLAAVGGPSVLYSGCTAPFDPPSTLDAVRILAVTADMPYGHPGESVNFKMTFVDGRKLDNFIPVQIVWLGGCFNPEGNQYFGCYEPLAELFEALAAGEIPPDGLIGQGENFELAIPEDIITSLPDPSFGPKYGLGYVFFLACAGEVRPVVQQGDTDAGYFPLGCFGPEGQNLGSEAFVPGFTQIYVFDDARENQNPALAGLLFDGEVNEAGSTVDVALCAVSIDERRKSGCAATDEFTECEVHELDVDVPDDVAEVDVESKDAEGNPLNEVVWVSYFATGGTFEGETKLVSDATDGIQTGREVRWVPPDEPGFYQIFAVVRDNRGGSSVATQFVNVTE